MKFRAARARYTCDGFRKYRRSGVVTSLDVSSASYNGSYSAVH